MDFLVGGVPFASLSILDLLHARDQFHAHLIHKANVVGTAIGRYLIRKTDPYPRPDQAPSEVSKQKKKKKVARTLENSEVREYSWPCVLVFVDTWLDDESFGSGGEIPASNYIPKTIYMEDGKAVPVCVVYAPRVPAAQAAPIDQLEYPEDQLSGGYPVMTTVQGIEHVASIGCLVTDGHKVYALTNRHVAGSPGEHLQTMRNGQSEKIGFTAALGLGRGDFEELYKPWPGKRVFINLDIGLIEIPDLKKWSTSIYGVGPIGPLAPLSIYNITLNLIGCPVRAHGAMSGRMAGRIAALFYRYKAIGGYEYIADFLIGSRTEEPLPTRHGDSGTVWVVENDRVDHDRMPIAVQWGGTVLGSDAESLPFALATNLSNVCRELDLELYRGGTGDDSFPYWGAVGHYTIGSLACDMVKDETLHELLMNNQDRISFKPAKVDPTVNDIKVPRFVPLADVPDKVWKKPFNEQDTPYGRKGLENPNHYADIDFEDPNGDTLDSLTPTVTSLDPATWRSFYQRVGWTAVSERGLLPFRVWQIYKKMVQFVRDGSIEEFVAAAGILAHYVGDFCQPLHGSYLDDGDPFRNPDGTKAAEKLGHAKGYAHGVHMAYEDDMIDAKYDKIIAYLQSLKTPHGMPLITGGQAAGFAVMELMRRTHKAMSPLDIVNEYGKLLKAGKKRTAANSLWTKFGTKTKHVIADGCKTLAMIWESAWLEGGAPAADTSPIILKHLQNIYEDRDFLPSKALGQIDAFL